DPSNPRSRTGGGSPRSPAARSTRSSVSRYSIPFTGRGDRAPPHERPSPGLPRPPPGLGAHLGRRSRARHAALRPASRSPRAQPGPAAPSALRLSVARSSPYGDGIDSIPLDHSISSSAPTHGGCQSGLGGGGRQKPARRARAPPP